MGHSLLRICQELIGIRAEQILLATLGCYKIPIALNSRLSRFIVFLYPIITRQINICEDRLCRIFVVVCQVTTALAFPVNSVNAILCRITDLFCLVNHWSRLYNKLRIDDFTTMTGKGITKI